MLVKDIIEKLKKYPLDRKIVLYFPGDESVIDEFKIVDDTQEELVITFDNF